MPFVHDAISWVMAGGLGAALLGPELGARLRRYYLTTPFAGARMWRLLP
ncbi:MAG: hypothetical protein R3E89_11680 [Thiolinea sp.]